MASFCCDNLNFESVTDEHIDLLHTWLNTPHVSKVWDGPQSIEAVRSKYRDKMKSDWQHMYIVSTNGRPFGYIQSYRAARVGEGWWSDATETTVGIDQFVGEPDFLGKGLGTKMVKEFSDWLLQQSDVTTIITDPDPTNFRAISCYRKAGFKEIGKVDTPDGTALLMKKQASY